MSNAPTTGEGPEGLGSSSPKSEDTHRAADGLVVVPREPTEAMLDAVIEGQCITGGSTCDEEDRREIAAAVWSAMIAATQQPAGEHADRLMQDFYLSQAYDPKAARPADVVKAAIAFALSATQQPVSEGVELAVWYGKMPESNGRENWTASVHRKGRGIHTEGFCLARSEYPDRVRYEADRMRWIIGELAEKPDILAYDEKLHSGYAAPTPIGEEKPEGGRP